MTRIARAAGEYLDADYIETTEWSDPSYPICSSCDEESDDDSGFCSACQQFADGRLTDVQTKPLADGWHRAEAA